VSVGPYRSGQTKHRSVGESQHRLAVTGTTRRVPNTSRLHIQPRSQEQYHAMSAQFIQVVQIIIVRREQVYYIRHCSPQPPLQSTVRRIAWTPLRGSVDTTVRLTHVNCTAKTISKLALQGRIVALSIHETVRSRCRYCHHVLDSRASGARTCRI
jgi:hypothetical protein